LKELVHLFGYERGELIGKSPSILNAGPEAVAVMKDIMRAIEKKDIWEGEIHNKRKDGTEFISYARISAVKDKKGEIINFLSTQHDITKRKHVEEALRESEEFSSCLLDDSPNPIEVINPDTSGGQRKHFRRPVKI
jgi:two-component system sensor histidine kinase/response regulator